ncbi:MAG: hypothetical protein AB7G68_03810 [Nitrospiraceae bacterium]
MWDERTEDETALRLSRQAVKDSWVLLEVSYDELKNMVTIVEHARECIEESRKRYGRAVKSAFF